MTRDDCLTLPLAVWARLRSEGLFFSPEVKAQDPDRWRFRFAPCAELMVHAGGDWEWLGRPGRAERLVVPLVRETVQWLFEVRGDEGGLMSPRPDRVRFGRPTAARVARGRKVSGEGLPLRPRRGRRGRPLRAGEGPATPP
jgi:hypothetical protein